jgi:hypothetical protein
LRKIIRIHLCVTGHDGGNIRVTFYGLFVSRNNCSSDTLVGFMPDQIYSAIAFLLIFFNQITSSILTAIINDDHIIHIIRHGFYNPANQTFFVVGRYYNSYCFVAVHNIEVISNQEVR